VNLLMRLSKILFLGWWQSWHRQFSPLDPGQLNFWCWPNDLDLNIHMNNGRYLTIMDLGRIHLMIRAGIVPRMIKMGWKPVIAAATVRFRRALSPFERFTLDTRVIGWDDRWIYIEQRFIGRDKRVKAIGLVKAAFTDAAGMVHPERFFALAPDGNLSRPVPVSPALNDYVRDWDKMLGDWPADLS
jgi:acyl-CoA thioesterase FadM